MGEKSEFQKTFELKHLTSFRPTKTPRAHQNRALESLRKWYEGNEKRKGALLVIPTGGGKTFTTARFLCQYALSDGCKVLWLAHTHHLLEQAYYTFAPKYDNDRNGLEIANVNNESGKLNLRVVSGEQNHYKVSDIENNDDILFCTLQSAVRAFNRNHPKFREFISNSKKLIVVFDEAHHSPANTYGQFMKDLYTEKGGNLYLLGLTATPTHSNELKRTYFKKLFPQGVLPLPVIAVSQLQAANILSKLEVLQPVKIRENIYKPTFTANDFNKWIKQFHKDIPEDIIEGMAKSRERNALIADTYNKKEHGRTIIFADRWYQCEMIVEMLASKNIKAGALYSHSSNQKGNADERNRQRRDKTKQAKDLADFRNGKLDVLVNINILTEGTDIPTVDTVFITRQTTSEIRLRQMIGRALRGPEFGGTETAKVVLFEDSWQFGDIFGEFATLPEDLLPLEFEKPENRSKRTIQLISVDLVKKLAQAMNEGIFTEALEFDNLFPVGWYEVNYSASSEDSDEIVSVNKLILVYSHEEEDYKNLISSLKKNTDDCFSDINRSTEGMGLVLEDLKSKFFTQRKSISSPINQNIYNIAKHLATDSNENEIQFFPFENRAEHNIELLAKKFSDQRLTLIELGDELNSEYENRQKFWKSLYPKFSDFKRHFFIATEKILEKSSPRKLPENAIKRGTKKDDLPDVRTIERVKKRDRVCQCCGEEKGKMEIDHIRRKYFEKDHSLENLQLLCRPCHKVKTAMDVRLSLNFRSKEPVEGVDLVLREDLFETPQGPNSAGEWKKFMKRVVSFYYGCEAVNDVKIGARGEPFYKWEVYLNPNIRNVPSPRFQRQLKSFINNANRRVDSIRFAKI